VNKRGVHADHHTSIYSGKKPVVFRGEREKGLTMRSIKVTPDNPRHRLDDASRLNYAKTYTVEYNVKVWFIGKISSDSEWQIRTDYNRVHPPLEIKGVRPPDTPDDTYEHAASATDYTTGGGYSASAGYYSGGSSGGTYNGGSYPTTATYDTYPSSSYGPSYGSHSSGSSYADYTASQQTPYGGEPGMGFNVDPGEDLRAPGDSDDTGDQKDGDRAGGQRKFQGY
jgi:hypothetical protein